MSKYIKIEDAIRAFKEWLAISEAAEDIIADLPTIEVSEDCISREWVRENMLKYGFLAPDMTVHEFVEDIPSVVPKQVTGKLEDSVKSMRTSIEEVCKEMKSKLAPTTEKSSMVGEWVEVDDGRVSCKCSICKEEYLLYEEDVFGRNYCPNCGAKMKGVYDE